MPTARAALLGATAVVAVAAAWTVTASATFLYGAGLWDAFPYPSWQWWQYLQMRGQNPTVDLWLQAAAGAATLLVGGLAGRLAYDRFVAPAPLHGKSAYASEAEAKSSGIVYAWRPRSDSILLGRTSGFMGLGRRYLCLPGTDHAALYARTGAGKGVSFVVPACLAWTGSLVAFDIKGELYRMTAGHRTALGQDCYFFSPTAPDGRSHRYNPFTVVPRGTDASIDVIHRIMHILIPDNPKSENPFWTSAARSLAAGGAIMLSETPAEPLTLAAVLRMFTRSDYEKFIRGLIAQARAAARPLPQTAIDAVVSWLENDDPKTQKGILEEVKAQLSLYASPAIAAATETSDFDLRDLRKRGMSIYIGATPDELRRLRPLMTVLFQQLVAVNTQVEYDQDPTHTHRVLMMLDEFWAPGRMNMLADAAAFVRSYGLRMAYVVQTKAQLVSIYGPEGSENLFQNTGAEIVFGASDMKLCREISERAGFDTVTEETKNRPRYFGWAMPGKQSASESKRRRALLLPQEVARLDVKEQLVFRPGIQPVRVKRIRWYDDPWFKRLPRQAPPVPALTIRVARDDGAARHQTTAQSAAWAVIP